MVNRLLVGVSATLLLVSLVLVLLWWVKGWSVGAFQEMTRLGGLGAVAFLTCLAVLQIAGLAFAAIVLLRAAKFWSIGMHTLMALAALGMLVGSSLCWFTPALGGPVILATLLVFWRCCSSTLGVRVAKRRQSPNRMLSNCR